MKAVKYLLAGLLLFGSGVPALAQDVSYTEALKPIEATLKANNDPKAVAKLLKDYQKTYKKNPKALVELGNTLAMSKHFDEANSVADFVISRNKTYGDAYILKGDIAAMQDDGGAAASWFRQAIQNDPKNPQGYMRFANVYRKVDPQASEDALNKLRQEVPGFPVEAEAAHTFYIAQNYEKAFEYYGKTNVDQLSDYQLTEFALSAYLSDHKEKAIELAEKGMAKTPTNASYARVALWSAEDLLRHEEAVGYGRQVVSNDTIKQSARDHLYYGLALKGCKKYDEAIQEYQKSYDLDKSDFRPYQYISEAYGAAGDEDKALEWNQKYMDNAQDVKPSDFAKLANIYVARASKAEDKLPDVKKAFEVYEKMAVKWPSLKGWAFTHAGMSASDIALSNPDGKQFVAIYDLAADYYKKAIDALKGSTDESSVASLKSCYQNLDYYYAGVKNDVESAKPYATELIKLDPNDANARKILGLDVPQSEQPAENASEK